MEIKFVVKGMTCTACSARVEKVSRQVIGVNRAEVNLLAGTMVVDADNESVKDKVIEAVTRAGYEAFTSDSKQKNAPKKDHSIAEMKMRIIGSACFLVVLMYFTMGHMIGLPMPHWYQGSENALVAALLQFFLTLPTGYLNRSYYSRGLKALWHRSPNMDSLIAVGSGAALVYGVVVLFRIAYLTGHGDLDAVASYSNNLYFESAAMIVTLITLGKFLEARAKGKTGDAIRQLMDLSPKTATVRRNGEEQSIPIEQVLPGDIVLVRSGGSIPVDGKVISGAADVDQSTLTGESIPVEKGSGDTVAAATINVEGYLEILAEKVGEDTTLSQVIRMVEQAGGSKAPIARLADKIAGVFVPVVMAIAAITFAIWMIVGKGLEFSLNAAIAVLVISCPCALGLATPVAIMVGTGRGARMGVLFKNAQALEHLHKVDTVVLDKTGTLTEGKPSVTDIVPNGISEGDLLQIAASIEAQSEHLFAKAILERAGAVQRYEVTDFTVLSGQGVSAIINEKKYFGGNVRLMDSLGIQVPAYPKLNADGRTLLYFACDDGTYLGMIAAADVLKQDSAAAVAELKRQKLSVVMLTGDNDMTARAIAEQAGVDEVIADVLPGDKANVVRLLREQGKNVLMVGDGINDAPALVSADVGMAIGAGTDIAIEAANVVLMSGSLKGVADAIALSKATIRNIRQNLFWAFFYNTLGIPIAAGALYPAFGILLSPMIGAAAMSLSSVFVVTNALRLRFFKQKHQNEQKIIHEEKKEEKNMTTIIRVNGMMCPHCKARVESVCKGFEGVTDAVVDLQKKIVTVTGQTDIEALEKAIVEAGYEVVD